MVISPVSTSSRLLAHIHRRTITPPVLVSQHVLSLSQMERLANVVNMSIGTVLRTRNAMYSLVCLDVERSGGTYTDEEVRDALCCDAEDVVILEQLLRSLHERMKHERLPDGVFFLLSFLIFFALFKLEQTGVNVDVYDAFNSLDPVESATVPRSNFIVLFFRYGTCGAVPMLNKLPPPPGRL